MSRVGPLFLIGTVVMWLVGLWTGWTLVFLGSGDVVRESTGEPVGVLGVVYFVGFNLVTLGVGDLVATGPGWGVISVVASFGGLFVLTLSITYLISVVSAVVSRRALAVRIASLGPTPSAIVTWAWNGREFSDAALQQVGSLVEPLLATSERHLAYPVPEHFESTEETASAPLAVARLDEALRLLENGVTTDHRPGAIVTAPLRAAVNRYIDVTLRNVAASSMPSSPPPPVDQLADLRRLGIPVEADANVAAEMRRHRTARSAMCSHVRNAGWEWANVYDDHLGRAS